MKSLQSRLQSRISKRSAAITGLLSEIRAIKNSLNGYEHTHIYTIYLRRLKDELREAEEDQKIDKQFISNVYWASV